MRFKTVISSGYTGRKLENTKGGPRDSYKVAWQAKVATMSPKGLADWTGKTVPVSCWFRCKQGPANLRCSLESSACFSGLCILDFSILYFFWCLIFGRLNEDLRKQWGLTSYKIDLIVLLKILNDRLTVECVRPLVHSQSLTKKKKNYPLTPMFNTL